MLRRSVSLFKQTLNPPKRVVPIEHNPLLRWSALLPSIWSNDLHPPPPLRGTSVGLEGCHSAFNATNAMRTCLYLGTGAPPTFLTLEGWSGIEHLQMRQAHVETDGTEGSCKDTSSSHSSSGLTESDASPSPVISRDVALFGDAAFFRSQVLLDDDGRVGTRPLVALENFTSRSKSIFRCRVPHHARVVVGHENNGVRASLVAPTPAATDGPPVADYVLFIPQYGTISSVNVVTSLGILLFYAFLDENFPESRTLLPMETESPETQSSGEADECQSLMATLKAYQRCFETALPVASTSSEPSQPITHANAAPRVDPRPMHPAFYKKDVESIRSLHETYRQSLLRYSSGCGAVPRTRFGLSVLYENDFDQRNFGGLIRSANAFLLDRVCYIGRRKYNVVGAVGSNHYTRPVYLGPVPDEYVAMTNEKQSTGALDHDEWIVSLQDAVAAACGGPSQWWLLDCGHDALYEAAETSSASKKTPEEEEEESGRQRHFSSPESLAWWKARHGKPEYTASLSATEEELRALAAEGVVLIVPQEGKLPHHRLLRCCSRIVTLFPPAGDSALPPPAAVGLPSQVASGIALQRLSAVMHPAIMAL